MNEKLYSPNYIVLYSCINFTTVHPYIMYTNVCISYARFSEWFLLTLNASSENIMVILYEQILLFEWLFQANILDIRNMTYFIDLLDWESLSPDRYHIMPIWHYLRRVKTIIQLFPSNVCK